MATPPDFTAGQILTAAQMNSVGLWLVKTETVGSAVASVTVSDAFSADYENYYVTYTGGTASGSQTIGLRLGAVTTNYNYVLLNTPYNNTPAALGAGSAASFLYAGTMASTGNHFAVFILAPELAQHTVVQSQWASTVEAGIFSGRQASTTQFTAFTLIAGGGGNMTGGVIRVYGMRE